MIAGVRPLRARNGEIEHEHGLVVPVAVRKHSRQLVIEPAADWPSQMNTIVPLPFSFFLSK